MRSTIRMVALWVGAVLLMLITDLVLAHFIIPNKPMLIVRMFKTPESSPDWPNILRQWNRVLMLQQYVISPLGGVIVGTLVGLLQRQHPVLLSFAVPLPETLDVFWSQRRNIETMSRCELMWYLAVALVPFISVAVAAWVSSVIRYGSHFKRATTFGSAVGSQ